MKPAGDHEMQDEPKIVFQTDRDAFADAAESQNLFSFGRPERRVGGAQEKWTGDSGLLQCLAEDAFFERLDVYDDVGQFRHVDSSEMKHGWKCRIHCSVKLMVGGNQIAASA